ncbi:excalibur calcium-binding domain-containing protein [Arthrobacter sp. OY3WO11]|uniref:excalibur calcium-binding domain-containing protein n=1 Tax=Arthrobacter sp. OY3WO11 TaxID=1835723 RepID=UPI0007CFA3F7|nr:excalibur calcium-binding domain-containing protein [Arthrobacter sp. OY3WO11]OAE00963.1 calcium-binding protein [Arthrobacter sp. OY3WO11]
MKKTLSLVLLTGLMLTGCGGEQAAVQPAETPTAVAAVEEAVTLPDVMGLALDKATDQLEDLGFEVEDVDTAEGKSIMLTKNWQVTSQDPAGGAKVSKGSTVKLGVTSLEKLAAEKAAAEQVAAEKIAAEKAAAEQAAAAHAAAEKAAADKAAADQAAAQQAAAEQAAQAAAEQAARDAAARQPAPVAPAPAAPAPSSVYYPNCAAAKAAGTAPLYRGQPGYRSGMDGDNDGVACER